MNSAIIKHFKHYQYTYIFIGILFGGGFLFGAIMNATHQSIYLFQNQFIEQLITLDNIKSYMYWMLFLFVIIIFNSFHVLGILVLSLITFLLGIHHAIYLISLCAQFTSFFDLIIDILFLISQWVSISSLLVGCNEIALNVFAVTFVFKETMKLSEIVHHFLNYGFISIFILFISIIIKTYLMKL